MAKTKKTFLQQKTYRSRWLYMLFFLLAFAVVGYAIYRIFAFPSYNNPYKVEAEKMTRPKTAVVVNDRRVSGKKAVRITKGSGTMTGKINFVYKPQNLLVGAKSTSCRGANPTIKLVITPEGGSARTFTKTVANHTWKTLRWNNITLAKAKEHKISLSYSTYSKTKKCNAKLYLDRVSFNVKLPEVRNVGADNTSSGSTVAFGTIDNFGVDAAYYFEYGATTSYGSTTVVTKLPASGDSETVRQTLTGLKSKTLYHLRLCVTNAAGKVCSQDVTFTSGRGGGGGSSTSSTSSGGCDTQSGGSNCPPSSSTSSSGGCKKKKGCGGGSTTSTSSSGSSSSHGTSSGGTSSSGTSSSGTSSNGTSSSGTSGSGNAVSRCDARAILQGGAAAATGACYTANNQDVGGTWTYNVVHNTLCGQFSDSGSGNSYSFDPNWQGTHTVTFTISNGGKSASDSVSVYHPLGYC